MILDVVITSYQKSQLKDQNIDLALLIESTQLLDRLWRVGITEVVRESAYHVISLKTRSLWVTLTSIASLYALCGINMYACVYILCTQRFAFLMPHSCALVLMY